MKDLIKKIIILVIVLSFLYLTIKIINPNKMKIDFELMKNFKFSFLLEK